MPVISLKGELGAFGVDDVLALVATKVGVLELRTGDRVAQIHLDSGEVVAGADGSSTDVVDVVAGLLRWTAGEFTFLDGERPPVDAPGRPIAEVLAAARAVMAEWLEVETVIPSLRAGLTLAAEAPSVDVRLGPSEWVAVAAIGSGRAAAEAATAVGNSLLFGMQVLKGLVERGLVQVGDEVDTPQPAPTRAPAVDLREPRPEPVVPAEPTADADDEPEVAVEAPVFGALPVDDPADDRRRLLGQGNSPLTPSATPSDHRTLPDLHSIEPFPQPSSSVESLARVLDAVNDVPGSDEGTGSGADDDRVALLKELEALRDGIRSTPAPPVASRPADPKVPAESRKGRRG